MESHLRMQPIYSFIHLSTHLPINVSIHSFVHPCMQSIIRQPFSRYLPGMTTLTASASSLSGMKGKMRRGHDTANAASILAKGE